MSFLRLELQVWLQGVDALSLSSSNPERRYNCLDYITHCNQLMSWRHCIALEDKNLNKTTWIVLKSLQLQFHPTVLQSKLCCQNGKLCWTCLLAQRPRLVWCTSNRDGCSSAFKLTILFIRNSLQQALSDWSSHRLDYGLNLYYSMSLSPGWWGQVWDMS